MLANTRAQADTGEEAQARRETAARPRLEVIPGAGHMSPVEQPERCLDVPLRF